jgi:DNA-binding NarL/FixJ family response regulator
MISVMVVDDHAVVRAGLARVLGTAPDLQIVAQASDGNEALELLTQVEPDVILMDLSMPGMDGITATRRILARRPQACVVALTSFGDRDRVITMVDAGARGYLVKDGDPEELVSAIRAAAAGGSPLAPVAASALLRSRQARSYLQDLTTREREVLELLAAGLSNRVIGERLGVTEATVKAHLTRVYTRLGVTDRVSAAMRAREMGLGPKPGDDRS